MHKIERDKKRRVYLVYRGVTVIGHARTMDCAQSMVDHDLMMMDQIARMNERYPLRKEG